MAGAMPATSSARGVGALVLVAIVACALDTRLGQAVASAAADPWSTTHATDWGLVDDALTVAEGSVAALGHRIEHLYEDIYIGLAMVVDQLRLEIRRLQPTLESALKAQRQSPSQSKSTQTSLAKAAAALNRTRELFKLALDIYQRGAPVFLDTLTMKSAAALLPIIRIGNWAFDLPVSRISADLIERPIASTGFLEDFSDFCILELSTPRVPEECKISSKCFDLMTDPYSDGYWLTHEVFYTLIAYVSPCQKQLQQLLSDHRRKSIKTFLRQTCSNIYRDAMLESDQGLTEWFQDLFMEQVGFCGLAGFPEFYKPEWIRAIRSWQREDGCYTDGLEVVDDPLTTFKRKPVRTKRAEIRLEDRCRPHKTVLGAIAMSTGLKYLINTRNLTIGA
ncbi:UPF0764 protein C16orf89 homolog [Amblyomma americanum]